MSALGQIRRPLPTVSPSSPSREAPIAAWLHRSAFSKATVAVTFPGTHKAFSLAPGQARKLREALQFAEAELAADKPIYGSINLMGRVSVE